MRWDDLLQEQLARLRGSWSAENQQAAVTYTPVQRGTSAPEVSAKRMEPPKRPPPPPPNQAPGEPLGKRPCLGSSCLTGSTTYHKPLVELGLQLEQRNAARHLVEQKQLWAPPPMKPPKLVQVLPNGIILPGLAPTLVYLPPPPAAPNTAFAVSRRMAPPWHASLNPRLPHQPLCLPRLVPRPPQLRC